MTENRKIIGLLAVTAGSLVFDSVAATSAGFYFIPALSSVLSFHYLPFTFSWLNALCAWTIGLVLIYAWAGVSGAGPLSQGFAAHAVFFVFLVVIFLYAFYPEKK